MTDEEYDLLRLVHTEAQGSVKKWVAMTELPSAALALARNGYLHQAGANTWQVALTQSGQALIRQLTGERPLGQADALLLTVASAGGDKLSDRYSLLGFRDAIERVRKECP